MHRHTAGAGLLLLCLLGADPAEAASGPYVQVFAGPNFLPGEEFEFGDDLGAIDPDYELGFNGGGALGYRFNDFLRLEADFETAEIAGIVDAEEFEADFFSHALRFEVRYRF